MLVLSRKPSQRIVIGDGIVLTVVGLDGGRVRLGIEAPAAVPVVRGELVGRDRVDMPRRRVEPNSSPLSSPG